jgi:hypothetical protein
MGVRPFARPLPTLDDNNDRKNGDIRPLFLLLLLLLFLVGVRLSPLGTAATTGLLYQRQMIDDGDCGAIGGMKIVRGNILQRHLSTANPT